MSKKRKYSDDEFAAAIRESFSVATALKKLGLKAAGGNYSLFHYRVKILKLDVSHFTGMGHLKGKTHNWNKKRDLSEILVRDSDYLSINSLKQRLLNENLLIKECAICHITDWLGKPLSLHLDHINGINNDHRKQNLRLLCPNCHSQTDTYAGKNKGKY